MGRLIFVFALIGATLACAPKPTDTGTGSGTAKVYLTSDQSYDPAKVKEYMGYFPNTNIEKYSPALGNFSGLGSANIGGKFSYTFTLYHSDCGKVQRWMDEIVNSSQYFRKNTVICSIESTSPTGATTEPNSRTTPTTTILKADPNIL